VRAPNYPMPVRLSELPPPLRLPEEGAMGAPCDWGDLPRDYPSMAAAEAAAARATEAAAAEEEAATAAAAKEAAAAATETKAAAAATRVGPVWLPWPVLHSFAFAGKDGQAQSTGSPSPSPALPPPPLPSVAGGGPGRPAQMRPPGGGGGDDGGGGGGKEAGADDWDSPLPAAAPYMQWHAAAPQQPVGRLVGSGQLLGAAPPFASVVFVQPPAAPWWPAPLRGTSRW
jgi:hypothetical protein